MIKRKIAFNLLIFDKLSDLSQNDQKLLKDAIAARSNAYAPYSKFKVGAAVLQAGARFPGVAITAIAISTLPSERIGATPAAPCGNCRQSIVEYEQRQQSPISIIMGSEKGQIYKCSSMGDILPLVFDGSFLNDS